MKKLKSMISVLLIAAMTLSLAGCGKKFDPIEDSVFEDALDEVFSVEEGDNGWRTVSNATGTGDYGYWSAFMDGTSIFRTADKIKLNIEYIGESDQYYCFIEFKDAEEGMEWFEDYIYSDFEDAIKDDDFEGSSSYKLTETMGYVLVNGENDSDFLEYCTDGEGDIYGGFFYNDGIFVAAFTTKLKDSRIEDVDAFLSAIGYPKP